MPVWALIPSVLLGSLRSVKGASSVIIIVVLISLISVHGLFFVGSMMVAMAEVCLREPLVTGI